MKYLAACAVASFALIGAASADTGGYKQNQGDLTDRYQALASDIETAEHSLKYSSMRSVIDTFVLDSSLSTLNKAREELRAGHYRTAQDLLRKASVPLTRMAEPALAGRHPDPRRHVQETHETLLALLVSARRIAEEKAVSTEFVERAQGELATAERLIAAGSFDEAGKSLNQAYSNVSRRLAELRSGEVFHIPAPGGTGATEWQDGLRRIAERRELTRYVEAEARFEGMDTRELERGTRAAEILVDQATALASSARYAQALAYLDDAYVLYEQSWRSVGIEW